MLNDALLGLLQEFFNQSYGSSLIIKGKPGAGKTTFVLEYLDKVREKTPIFYLTTRFSEDPLLSMFPWLNEVTLGSRARERNTVEMSESFRGNFKILEKMIEEGKLSQGTGRKASGLMMNIEELLPELNSLYSFVDININKSPLIVVDSIEALAEKYEINTQLLFTIIQKDLVESSGANIILIMEQFDNSTMEYYANGVVTTSYNIINGFLYRTVILEKLMGVSIGSNPIYIFSLEGGRFQSFNRIPIVYPKSRIQLKPSENPNKLSVPLGNKDLAKVLDLENDSLPIGSVIVLHRKGFSTAVDKYVNLIKNNLVKRTIADSRGVIDVSSGSNDTSRVLMGAIDPEFTKYYITAEKSERSSPYIINLSGSSLADDFPQEVIDFYTSNANSPYVFIFSTDFLSFIYHSKFYGDLSSIINNVRSSGIVVIIADDEEYKRIFHFANYVIHFEENFGYVTLYSDPSTLYVGTVDYNGNWPELKLSVEV